LNIAREEAITLLMHTVIASKATPFAKERLPRPYRASNDISSLKYKKSLSRVLFKRI